MKTLFTLFISCVIVLLPFTPVQAQTGTGTEAVRQESVLDLPPLADLIDSAIKHSAGVRYRQQDVASREAGMQSEKTYWARNLGMQADTRYGTFDNFSSNANGQSTTIQSITSRQLNYGVGLYIKFPLQDIINRKNQIKQAQAEMNMAKSMQESQEDEIRQQVIKSYQEVLMKQRLVNIRAHAFGTAKVNMDMVEKEFRNGVISVTEYVRISGIVADAEAAYETTKSEFAVSKQLLEDIIGFPIQSILKRVP